jgi:hypothetical protein
MCRSEREAIARRAALSSAEELSQRARTFTTGNA